jgi:predicted O-methyltransferase YrrM
MMWSFANSPGFRFLLWRCRLGAAMTQTSTAERECLGRHAANRRRLVEIGVWHGVTTRRLRSTMAADGILFAIDPFPPSRFGFSWEHLIAQGEVSRESNGEVRFLVMTSAQAADRFNEICREPLDFIFIDGEHSYDGLQADWTLWAPRIAAGGIVALHDSRSLPDRRFHDNGSVRFTNERILPDQNFKVLETVDSLTVLERQT